MLHYRLHLSYHDRCTIFSYLTFFFFFFFFNDTATTEIYTLSLHDALPIYEPHVDVAGQQRELERAKFSERPAFPAATSSDRDRKSTRLNSSHLGISYAVFCLKKKKYWKQKKMRSS